MDKQQIEKIMFDYVKNIVDYDIDTIRKSILPTSVLSTEEIINIAYEIACDNIEGVVTTTTQRLGASVEMARRIQARYYMEGFKWNDARKSLPKDGEYVLVYKGCGIGGEYEVMLYSDGKFDGYSGTYSIDDKLIFWTNLPNKPM